DIVFGSLCERSVSIAPQDQQAAYCRLVVVRRDRQVELPVAIIVADRDCRRFVRCGGPHPEHLHFDGWGRSAEIGVGEVGSGAKVAHRNVHPQVPERGRHAAAREAAGAAVEPPPRITAGVTEGTVRLVTLRHARTLLAPEGTVGVRTARKGPLLDAARPEE